MGKRYAIALPFLLFLGLFARTVMIKDSNSEYEYFACRDAEVNKVSKARFLIVGTSHVRYFPILLKDEDDWAAISISGSLFNDQARLLHALENKTSYSVIVRPLHKLELHLPIKERNKYFDKLVAECSRSLNEKLAKETAIVQKYFYVIRDIYRQLQVIINPASLQDYMKSYAHDILNWERPITAYDAESRFKVHKEVWDFSEDSSELSSFLGSLPRRVKCVVLVDSPITDIYDSYLTEKINNNTSIKMRLETLHSSKQRRIIYLSKNDLGISIPATTKYYSDADHLSKEGSAIYLGAIKRAMRDLKLQDSCG